MKKQWQKLLATVAAFMGFDPNSREQLNFSEEEIKKLDQEAKIEGFAEAFMKKFNAQLAAEEDNAQAQQIYAQFMEEFNESDPPVESNAESQEETEGAAPPEVPVVDKKTLAQAMQELTTEIKAERQARQNAEANLQKLKTTPEEDIPEAVVTSNPQAKVKHSKTHLFASGNTWDSLDRPWNKAVAEGKFKAATDWNNVNIEKLNEDLGAYSRRNAMTIQSLLLDGYDLPEHWSIVSNIQDEYVFSGIVTGEITQAFKKAWLPKNRQRFVPVKNKIFDKQIDITWEMSELKKIEKSWLNMFFNEGSTPYKMSFARFLIEEILKKARKEDKISIFKGVYANPDNTPGVPGSFLNAMDGFLKVISKHRDVDYKSSNVGIPTEVNIYDYVNDWVKVLPVDFRNLPDLVFGMSGDYHKAYHNARELKKGTNTDYTANNSFVDQYPNIRFVAHEQLNGSNFMYITTSDNIGLMVDRNGEESLITLEKEKRAINAFGDYKLGVYFKAFGAKVDPAAPLDYENQLFFSNDVEVLDEVYVPVAPNDATPSVKEHNALVIGENNTAATDITKIDDVEAGKMYYLLGNADTNISTVKNNANIILDGTDFPLNKGNLLVLIGQGEGENAKVIEYSRTVASSVPEPEKVTLAADATTANAEDGTWFVTSENTQATALTDIENAITGETYTIEGGSDTQSTTIASAGKFLLTEAFTAGLGATLKVKYNGSKFIELSRTA